MGLRNAFELLATDAKLELVRLLLSEVDDKLNINQDGRLRVSTMPGRYDLLTQSITAAGQTFSVNVENISNVMVHCKADPLVAGHTAYFEASLDSTDGVNGTWFAIQAVRSNANIIETYTGTTALAATPTYGWELSVNALRWIRVRCSAHTSGTMTWMIQPGSFATEPIPANQVTTVTATANDRGSGAWMLETSTNLANGATFTGTSRACGSSSVQYYGKMRVRVYSSHAGTLTIESSQNSTSANFRARPEDINIAINAGEVKMVDVPVIGYYCRCKFTNTGGATTTTLEILSTLFMEGSL